MMALCTEDKLLPASVVRRVTAERVAELEEQYGNRLGGKHKREIREQVTDELLPRAFTRLRTAFAYLDPTSGWLVVDAATPKRAEEVTALLFTCVNELQLRPPRVNESPAVLMTEWLNSGEAPAGFSIDTECELASPEDGGAVVRCSRQNLDAQEIRVHVAAGKRAVKLAMTWADRISFVLTEQLHLKRLGFLDILQEEAADSGADGGEQQFDADFAIMGAELGRFIPALLDALGGEAAQPV
jgi:recombination associated protein RdgC